MTLPIICPFRTEQGTCKHVDAAVGSPVVVPDDACRYCIKSHPDANERHESKPVLSWIKMGKRGIDLTKMQAAAEAAPKPKSRKKGCNCGKRKPVRQKPSDQTTS